MPHFSVVGADADDADLWMATMRNEYKTLPSAPATDFILVTCILDDAGTTRLMRVVGVTEETMQSLDTAGEIQFSETIPEMRDILRAYFSARNERLHRFIAEKQEPKTLSKLIQ